MVGHSNAYICFISEITNIHMGSLYFGMKCLGKPFVCLGTIMCFGQTGAGKTYSMTGAAETYKQRGIIPRALQEVIETHGKEAHSQCFSSYS